jgi:hypothetical protein
MKRICLLFLTLILLSACGQEKATTQTLPSSTNGLELKLETVDKTLVTFTIYNSTNKEVTYGEPFHIEEKKDDVWYKVNNAPTSFIAIAGLLPPHSSVTETHDISIYRTNFSPGSYRLVKVINGTELAIPFEIID